MLFLTGKVTFLRFKVDGPSPRQFTEDHLDRLRAFQAGRQRIASADGIEVGWSAGDHMLDTEFTLEKNIVNDSLLFDLRIDTDKIPADLLKSYYTTELKALSKDNPSGIPTARQKREAKESARELLEQEAKDGRYKKRKCIPVMWDVRSNEVLFGATSTAQFDRLMALFQHSFGYRLDPITAGNHAQRLAEIHNHIRQVDDSCPSPFVPGTTPENVAWVPDDTSRDFLGNEFLLWLWFVTESDDTIKVTDKHEFTIMVARTLSLECPRGQTGSESFRHLGPTSLPEALRGIQLGKLPRKCGLTMVAHDEQYELTIHAETLAIGAAKLPNMPEDVIDARAKMDTRIDQVRALVGNIDLLYMAFVATRLGKGWKQVLSDMQAWLKGE